MPTKTPPKASGPKLPEALTRKIGPAPAWVWGVTGIVAFVVYRRYANKATSSPSALVGAPTTGSATTSGGGSAGGTSGSTGAGSGMGTAVDNLNPDLLNAFGGLASALSYSLVSAVSGIESLGTEALAQSGATQRASWDSITSLIAGSRNYAPLAPTTTQTTVYVSPPQAPPASGGGGAQSSSSMPVTYTPAGVPTSEWFATVNEYGAGSPQALAGYLSPEQEAVRHESGRGNLEYG